MLIGYFFNLLLGQILRVYDHTCIEPGAMMLETLGEALGKTPELKVFEV